MLRMLTPWGQEHLLRHWSLLDDEQRRELAEQIRAVDFALLERLRLKQLDPSAPDLERIEAPPVVRPPESFEEWEQAEKAAELGEAALNRGEVAICLVAGGQGTRLGHPGPKGTFVLGPISQRTLFQIHAEKVLALSRRHEQSIPFYIMTSQENDEATRAFFAEHRDFGLQDGQIVFFQQGMMPAVDAESGKVLLAGMHQLALSPNGHGGTLEALAQGGHLRHMRDRGIRHLYYFQVDNPLVKVGEVLFLGRHIQAMAEVSCKVVPKRSPGEKVGVIIQNSGRLQVLEYSELPAALAERRTPQGRLEFDAGSIAIHIFDVPFLERLATGDSILPYHLARKKVPYVDERGQMVRPEKPNALKFEMFVFDTLPVARQACIVETSHAEEFEPLKNAEGENSPATVRQAMSALYADWLDRAGVKIPRDRDGFPLHPIEISPLVALDAEELRSHVPRLQDVNRPLLLTADRLHEEPESSSESDEE
jgi:UDP-N-acetylglucosamine/UDP-N-acetylgalactosamine diphosphorylase